MYLEEGPVRESRRFTVLCKNMGISLKMTTALSLPWLFHSRVDGSITPCTDESWSFPVKGKSCHLLKFSG